VSEWQDIICAPYDRIVLLLIGETIPGTPHVMVGQYASGDTAEELGYHEYAKHGGWLIFNSENDFYVIGYVDPTHWMPLPSPPVTK